MLEMSNADLKRYLVLPSLTANQYHGLMSFDMYVLSEKDAGMRIAIPLLPLKAAFVAALHRQGKKFARERAVGSSSCERAHVKVSRMLTVR